MVALLLSIDCTPLQAINALAHEKELTKLKHGKAVVHDVNETLNKEGKLLEVMKKGDDLELEEELGALAACFACRPVTPPPPGEELGEEAAETEEDAEHLLEEAEAGDFDNLDEKLLDEQLAKELIGDEPPLPPVARFRGLT